MGNWSALTALKVAAGAAVAGTVGHAVYQGAKGLVEDIVEDLQDDEPKEADAAETDE